jgi:hypothetical protein
LRKIRTQSGNAIFPEAPALLDARWQTWVAENWPQWVAEKWLGYPDQANFIRDAHFAVAGQTMTGQEILDALEPVLEAVLLTLESVRPVDKSASWTPNWEPTADNGKLAGLYRAFGEFANEVANQALAAAQESLQAGADRFQPDQALDDLLRQFADKDTNGWRARSAGIDGLIEMILFEGWSTEGPQAQHDR